MRDGSDHARTCGRGRRRRGRWTAVGTVLALISATLVPGVAVAADDDPPPLWPCPAVDAPAHSFTDAGGTHGEAIACLAATGVALGRDTTTFGTLEDVTRGQLASFVVRLLDRLDATLPEGGDRFPDAAGGPHAGAIARLAAVRPAILRGFEDGTFRPTAPVTRAQTASIVVRVHDHLAAERDDLDPLPRADGPSFPDAAGSVHEDAIGAAAEAGLVRGFDDGRFAPAAPVRRGQVASVLWRLLERVAPPEVTDPDPDPDPDPEPTGNVWIDERRVANIAHAGGIHEAPQNTLYALGTAQDRGADVLEMDLQLTADGHIVVIHDSTVDRTTDGTGCVVDHTLEELRELDAAHTHVDGEGPRDGRPDEEYRYRGIATGEQAPPAGFAPEDLRIPTLAEVFERHGGTLMNVEMKHPERETRGGVTYDCPTVAAENGIAGADIAAELARLIDEHDVADTVLVASFIDAIMAEFVAIAPHVDTTFPLFQGAGFFAAFLDGAPTAPNPAGHVALQVPLTLNLGGVQLEISEEFVAYAREQGIAVHVWTINDPDQQRMLVDWGVDGIITDRVVQLDGILTEAGVPRPTP
jgi:glycerophosphoryl diester phosphodiesterase